MPPDWVQRLWVRRQQGGQVLGVYSLVDLGDKPIEILPSFVFGCNYSVRKRLAIELGGFNPDGFPRDFIRYRGNGEMALGQRLQHQGFKIVYHPKASVDHFVSTARISLKYVSWRYYIEGISRSYSDIRKANGLRTKDAAVRYGKNLLRFFSRIYDPLSLQWLYNYHKGYFYHRTEVQRDPDLLTWVLRPNYWESSTYSKQKQS